MGHGGGRGGGGKCVGKYKSGMRERIGKYLLQFTRNLILSIVTYMDNVSLIQFQLHTYSKDNTLIYNLVQKYRNVLNSMHFI